MIPDSFGAFAAFLGLVAPGLVLDLVLERRLPRRNGTSFREASTIALASLIFTLISILLLAALRTNHSMVILDAPQWIKGGKNYLADHFSIVILSALLEVLIACSLAALSAWFITRKSTASMSNVGTWYQILRNERPPGTRPWVHLHLDDETDFWGYLRHYTTDDSADVREIVLGGNSLAWRRKNDEARSPIGGSWDSVCINADRIQYMRVIYRSLSDENLLGRKTEEHPHGEPRIIP
jgi:Family of unknown function (DUF6338)